MPAKNKKQTAKKSEKELKQKNKHK